MNRSQGTDAPCTTPQITAPAMADALESGEWDVVLCDYVMPAFDPGSALKLARRRDPDIPFIVTSGSIDEETVVEMMHAGADDYVMKGNLLRLAPAIKRAIRTAGSRSRTCADPTPPSC